MPKKENEYFQNLKKIDIAGKQERLTDCWDYSQLFKNVFNLLSNDYNIGSRSYRVIGDTYFNFMGLEKKLGDHDFNLVKSRFGKKRYIDTNGQDTYFISNPVDITKKVRVYHNKAPSHR